MSCKCLKKKEHTPHSNQCSCLVCFSKAACWLFSSTNLVQVKTYFSEPYIMVVKFQLSVTDFILVTWANSTYFISRKRSRSLLKGCRTLKSKVKRICCFCSLFLSQNCNLTGCDLQDANLRGANITGATIADITGPLHMTAFVRNQLPGSRLISSPPDS